MLRSHRFGLVVCLLIAALVLLPTKPTLRELNVADRSTLVAFNGKLERKRSSFVTDAAAIRALFESAR